MSRTILKNKKEHNKDNSIKKRGNPKMYHVVSFILFLLYLGDKTFYIYYHL